MPYKYDALNVTFPGKILQLFFKKANEASRLLLTPLQQDIRMHCVGWCVQSSGAGAWFATLTSHAKHPPEAFILSNEEEDNSSPFQSIQGAKSEKDMKCGDAALYRPSYPSG